jgi:type IV pilus assembly protein PilQ
MRRNFAVTLSVIGLVACGAWLGVRAYAQSYESDKSTRPAAQTAAYGVVPQVGSQDTKQPAAVSSESAAAQAAIDPAAKKVDPSAAVNSPEQAAVSAQPTGNAPAQPVEEEAHPAVMQLDMTQAGNVSLDFRDADIRNVLKVLAYKSGVNIIPGPEVVGLVNIQLKDVPWQKALDVILSTYGYGFEQKGTIITVTTIDNLKKRREDAKSLAEQEPLSTETFILRFGKASEVRDALDKMKTARGNVNFDKRTNAVIVSDVSSNLQLIHEVVKSLDAVTPQVLIEAKIIETTLSNDENLGIDWTTKASITGPDRSSMFPWSANTKSKFFAPTTFPSTTLTYGTLSLSQFQAVLNMLKNRTNTNIVSNPRIVTLDNQPAKITVGKQYPVPQYSYNEQQAKLQVSGWSYLDIGVIFNVTPHVNNAGLVTLDIEPSVTDILEYATVENTTMPVLSSESAKTSVMIKDGETLVIAGLIKDKTVKGKKKIPFLGDIPILGWPFQSSTTSVTKTDLLIFLTPHIITPEVEALVPIVKAK